MGDLNGELTHLARAIAQGGEISSQVGTTYSNYCIETALEVYRNNYRGNLQDALAGAYPVIKQLVGDDFFRFLAKKFIECHPSHSGNLYHYGAELADFLSSFVPAQGLIYLSDVAVLEWACHLAYFATDADTLALDRLADIAPEHYPELILLIHPACQVVRSHYPIIAIWQAHQSDNDGDFHINLDDGGGIALVSRKDDVVKVSKLSGAEADWLQNIQAGNPLGTATESALKHLPGFDLQTALLNLVAQNVLTGFKSGATL
ncbi:MAG: DNA-binding domain-containing protein [Gallionella sp.]|nr:DNA-binding domain-containing protein [Gallionella sp.]